MANWLRQFTRYFTTVYMFYLTNYPINRGVESMIREEKTRNKSQKIPTFLASATVIGLL